VSNLTRDRRRTERIHRDKKEGRPLEKREGLDHWSLQMGKGKQSLKGSQQREESRGGEGGMEMGNPFGDKPKNGIFEGEKRGFLTRPPAIAFWGKGT